MKSSPRRPWAGQINVVTDYDGPCAVRHCSFNFEEKLFPSFALQLTLRYLNLDLKALQFGSELRFGRKSIPLYEGSKMLIAYNTGIPTHSFFDVVNKKVAPELFRDKIVIIALSAAGLGAMQVTPIAVNVRRLIIANVIDNSINDNHV
jgi:CHASE2 domain-containing sensor protein